MDSGERGVVSSRLDEDMKSAPRYRVNAPPVTDEVIDGEALIINFESGAYYCLAGTGLAVWEAIARGESVAEIVADFGRRYEGDAAEIERAVTALVAELLAENLIVAEEALRPINGKAPETGARVPFVPPVLSKYSDMEDFLLVDPIHETDESGWPRRKTD